MFTHTRLLLVALCLLTACDTTSPALEQLRVTAPLGNVYQVTLANNYKVYAETLEAKGSSAMAEYFAQKGLYVAQGKNAMPEDPSLWQLDEDARKPIDQWRADVLRAVDNNSSTQPEISASTMLAFDQLVVMHDQMASAEEIAAQEAVLKALLAKLTEAHVASESAPPPPPTIPAEVNRTVLYFPYDSDRLGDSARVALDQLTRDVKKLDKAAIAINGHADKAGTEEYNMRLSERRAMFVQRALEKAGVPKVWMQHFAFGESDPAVPTADGVAEPKNRRVEVTIE